MSSKFKIGSKYVGDGFPTYFIADIAANHDGSLSRALELIRLAAEAGADAAKFQHFEAETIVSKSGFDSMGQQIAHQSKWSKSVFEVYSEASLPFEWTPILASEAEKYGIDFFTAPYSLELVRKVEPFIPVFKVGSGDLTWIESIKAMAEFGKPILIATGASELSDVHRAVDLLESMQIDYSIMQCNTNYTGDLENARFANLRVLSKYAELFPNAVLGLSDHTHGPVTVLGAIALGARIIEKHFTDDTSRSGPDHGFSLDPVMWAEMIQQSRLLEAALGDGLKKIEPNEIEAAIVQRRSIRYSNDLKSGQVVGLENLSVLRPRPTNGMPPYDIDKILGKRLVRDVFQDELANLDDFI